MLRIFLISIVLIFTINIAQASDENINDFESKVYVNKDATLDVMESISVYASLENLKHGLIRHLPREYKDNNGNVHRLVYQIQSAQINNHLATYQVKKEDQELTVLLGREDRLLMPGYYSYTLKYHVKNAFSFFHDRDELFWHVTGAEWTIPIRHARVFIDFPKNATITNYAGYTGLKTATDQQYQVFQKNDSVMIFETTAPLLPGEGFIIAVGIDKGALQQPYWINNLSLDLQTKDGQELLAFFSLFLVIYLIVFWRQKQRNNGVSKIALRTQPPYLLSPAAVRFIHQKGFDLKTLSAAIINIAIKGFLKVNYEKNLFTLIRQKPPSGNPTPTERLLLNILFEKGHQIELNHRNLYKINRAKNELHLNLKKKYQKRFFINNGIYMIPGVLIGLFAFIIAIFSASDYSAALFAIIWLTGWTIAFVSMIFAAQRRIRQIWLDFSLGNIINFLFAILLVGFFIFGEIAGLFIFSRFISLITLLFLAFILVLNIFVYRLLKTPTGEGQAIADKIQGFKIFLTNSSTSPFNSCPIQDSEKLFEKYLPYAIALNVESAWGKNFNQALKQAGLEPGQYQPSWYSGTPFFSHLFHFKLF